MQKNSYTKIGIKSNKQVEFLDMTTQIQDFVLSSGVNEGICTIFSPHTTAGITINENADFNVKKDLIMALDHMVSEDLCYQHAEGNSTAHIKTVLTGNSAQVFVSRSNLLLGTWQGIYFCEFDGPRERTVYVNLQRSTYE